ncbi:MAG: hypothetical protein LBS19_12705 [Clostridiales bacterium]|jgi:outer membrane lipoprotein-sorting protein|nr:hypothetical protein [Clostridiales bacterium]
MKRITRVFTAAVLGLAMILSGCRQAGEVERSAYEQIQNQLLTMSGYESQASVTYITNKNQHTYQTLHQARMTGEYRIEVTGPERVAGNVTINDNSSIVQFNTRVKGRIAVLPAEVSERMELFVTSFVKNYIKSQEVTITVSGSGESMCTVLEAVVPGSHPYLRTEKLWVNNKTLKPVKLSIYDPDGVERITVAFDTFEYNVNFDDSIFKVQ